MMRKGKNLSAILLVALLFLFSGIGTVTQAHTEDGASTDKAPSYEKVTAALNGSGQIKFKFKKAEDKNWVQNITAVYLFSSPMSKEIDESTLVNEKNLLPKKAYSIDGTRLIIDSKLFPVKPSDAKSYDIVIQSKGHEDYEIILLVKNLRPVDFIVRSIDKNGNVRKIKSYTYDEMVKMATKDEFYSIGCVMHGLVSMKGKGIYLADLLKDADIEFGPGMSMAVRTTDAPEVVEATKMNSSEKTGLIVHNPQKYWMKPRYAHDFKYTYEDLFQRKRFFLTGIWDNESIRKTVIEDKANFSFKAREALASDESYMREVSPMIALKYTTLEYGKNDADIRTFVDKNFDLKADERAFRLMYGIALDDDPTVNVTAFNADTKEYPIVTSPENKGKIAVEEGPDPCGLSARSAQLIFGIDIFQN